MSLHDGYPDHGVMGVVANEITRESSVGALDDVLQRIDGNPDLFAESFVLSREVVVHYFPSHHSAIARQTSQLTVMVTTESHHTGTVVSVTSHSATLVPPDPPQVRDEGRRACSG